MTTELQSAAVELQQSEAKRAELLPDKVEKSLSDVACGVADYSDCEVLRAHIAAQSSEIEALRNAIIQYVICCPADRDTTNDFLEASYKLDEVLAQGAKNDNI